MKANEINTEMKWNEEMTNNENEANVSMKYWYVWYYVCVTNTNNK